MQRRGDGNAASGGVAVAAQERAADALAADAGSAGHLRSALTVEGEAAGAAGTSGASESAAEVARGEGHGLQLIWQELVPWVNQRERREL